MSLVLTREGLDREILRLAIPAALQNLMLTAIFVVDTKMIAVFAAGDPEPLAALGITGPFVWALSVIFTVTSVGTTALVARRVGEGSPGSASQVAGTAALLALGVGAAVALLGLPLCQPLVAWVTSLVGEGGDPALAADASGYLWWILFFFPLRSLAITLEAALRGAGDSATPLWGGILSNVANVAGNALLIFGLWGFPRMGVAGAGLASALAPGAECLLLG
ncbi:MAG: MATE family efflux transporter, partial [Planctomycetota bacterium]